MSRRWTSWAGAGALVVIVGWLVAVGGATSGSLGVNIVSSFVAWTATAAGIFLLVVAAVLLALRTAGLYDPSPAPRPRAYSRLPDEDGQDAAVETAVLEGLQEGPATAEELAARADLYPVVVRRVLPQLVAKGVVTEEAGTYRSAQEGTPAGA